MIIQISQQKSLIFVRIALMKIAEPKVFKVSQINAAVRNILEANFAAIWLEGEISNLTIPSSGHMYFSLKDELAQVRAVMFRSRQAALQFQPENGAQVIVAAQVSLYEPRGDYQLLVEQMNLAGAGMLHAKFLQLKAKLAAEKLFATTYKRELPCLPKYVGVITSPTGAAIRDILSVLTRRFPGVDIIIYPAQVQGSEAAMQIVTAIQDANKRSECDVLILARGGGSLEDLWPFNEEIVARAIFASEIPIVSAIGHETDFTIADFVADVRAPTPSVAAELVVPDAVELKAGLIESQQRLLNSIQHKLQQAKWLLSSLSSRLVHPRHYLLEQAQHLDELERRLQAGIQNQVLSWQHRLAKAAAALELVSPLATLERGYAIVSYNSKIINKVTDIAVGAKVQTRLADGVLDCLVEEITSHS